MKVAMFAGPMPVYAPVRLILFPKTPATYHPSGFSEPTDKSRLSVYHLLFFSALHIFPKANKAPLHEFFGGFLGAQRGLRLSEASLGPGAVAQATRARHRHGGPPQEDRGARVAADEATPLAWHRGILWH